jgi:hypothetical protein
MRIDLGDGLILRESNPNDVEAISQFFAEVFGRPDKPATYAADWVADLLSGSHPTVTPSDFSVVEDTKHGRIASSCGFIPQTWLYEDISFGVGQIELVGTRKEYRRNGLVRKQLEVIHRWSHERGHMVNAIGGLKNYYRQFGYEMTLDNGGGRSGSIHHVPKLGKDESEEFNVRPSTSDDIPFFTQMYKQHASRLTVTCVRDETNWHYDLHSGRKNAFCASHIIERTDGDRVGILMCQQGDRPMFDPLMIDLYELIPGVSWLEATPSVLRWFMSECENRAAKCAEIDGEDARGRSKSYFFQLPMNHPVFEAIPEKLPETHDFGTWFIRVPDLSRFIKHITPALERRLAESVACGHSGELKISFFRDGLRIRLENGHLAEVEPWQPTVEDQGNAFFPDLTFMHLVFGHRTVEEINSIYPDCNASSEQAATLRAMFPKRPSRVSQIF